MSLHRSTYDDSEYSAHSFHPTVNDDFDNPVVSSSFRKNRSTANVHVRQNFVPKGAPGGYVPPSTYSSTAESRASPPSSFDGRASPEMIDVPFDMTTRDTRVVAARANNDEAIAERMQPFITVPQQSGHEFSIKGPRYSDPSTSRIEDGHIVEVPSIQLDQFDGAIGDSKRMTSKSQPQRRGAHYAQRGYNQWERVDSGVGEDEQDLFDGLEMDNVVEEQFPEANRREVKVTHRIRRRTPVPISDETSTEAEIKSKRRSPTNLQERSQQAWKSRQKKNSFQKKSVEIRAREIEEPPIAKVVNKVTFGGENGVRYYEHPNDGTDQSFDDDKSLNSEYTKTLESEVEDMIKDVLFIGNPATSRPGRRKYKYKHEVKKRLKEKEASGISRNTEHMETLHELDEDKNAVSKMRESKKLVSALRKGKKLEVSANMSSTKEQKSRQQLTGSRTADGGNSKKSHDSSEAEGTLWSFVEGGMFAVSTALGLVSETPAPAATKGEGGSLHEDNFCAEPIMPFGDCGVEKSLTSRGQVDTASMSEVVSYAQKKVYRQLAEADKLQTKSLSQESSDDIDFASSQESSMDFSRGRDPVSRRGSGTNASRTGYVPFALDRFAEDPSFAELALHAANSLHQTGGVDFDKSFEISMENDVQVSVVELKLPLGLIFLENEGGSFVTKVDQNGSAARSGGVEVGDQLAAINGTSCFRMKVEDICDLVSSASNPQCVELIFVRYIGPFRPSRGARTNAVAYDVDMTNPRNTLSTEGKKQKVPTSLQGEGSKRRGFRIFGRGKKKGP